jgi:hypothetical protein
VTENIINVSGRPVFLCQFAAPTYTVVKAVIVGNRAREPNGSKIG